MAANTASLHAAMEFVRTGALEASLPEARIGELDLLIEEIFMNVCCHAYPDGRQGVVTLTYSVPAPGELSVEVADQGAEFNPLTARAAGLNFEFGKPANRRLGHLSGEDARSVHNLSPGSRLEPSDVRHISGLLMAIRCG